MERFEGTRVLLTGAGSGIGRATVQRLVSEGADVFGVDRSEVGLKETAATLEGPGRLTTHVADVADEPAVIEATRTAAASLGGIDVLVNVAGILDTTPIVSLQRADLQRLLDVNLVGTMLFCREALAHLPDSDGVIVNTASTAATHAHPYMSAYAASKGAVLAFSISLAAELAPRRIRVVPVSPGGVDTPLSANPGEAFNDVDTRYYARIMPLNRMGRPEDLAGAIAFAASSDAAYLTGTELRVDGGSHG